jgi:plasmid stabilization system protein ParE
LAVVTYSAEAFADFERFFDFPGREDAAAAAASVAAIREAISILSSIR